MADVISILLQDHNEVRQLFGQLDSAVGAEQRTELFHKLVRELAMHETAEEEVVYPALRKDAADGDAVADARIEEEGEAEKLLSKMEKMDVASEEFARALDKLRAAVLQHAEKEESEVFPRLRQAESEERLEAMGKILETAKKTAPTHPHPHVPNTAAANMAAGPMAAVFDRARDAIRDVRQRIAS